MLQPSEPAHHMKVVDCSCTGMLKKRSRVMSSSAVKRREQRGGESHSSLVRCSTRSDYGKVRRPIRWCEAFAPHLTTSRKSRGRLRNTDSFIQAAQADYLEGFDNPFQAERCIEPSSHQNGCRKNTSEVKVQTMYYQSASAALQRYSSN